ncbi:patatin-like phospholipase family protein [Sediminitomix flava]|uniref:NTE family protein n=1 Tax=Sediminitomix flava TaxID=379075 RepID=A0A315ZCR0_SEDFL|nr:patatin-like phospholipase family protein [Sediminitomix flava]PWJ42608.1 NTE family protein [Sediminitomix flava]
MKIYLTLTTILLSLLFSANLNAQTELPQKRKSVGVVFSGGGAKGIALVGVLKVLEENGIPIDYITGTSMGAIIGGFYAAGYNAHELDSIIRSEDFQIWTSGDLPLQERNLFWSKPPSPGWVDLQVSLDSSLQTTFQRSFLSDASLNFALSSFLFEASDKSNYNFDSLPIPFRCVASNVFSKKQVILKEGDLAQSIRASMAVPLVYRPVKIDNRYLFDGLVYNNFPVSVMIDEFNPDVIIGVNLGTEEGFEGYPEGQDEELIKNSMNVITFLMSDKSKPTKYLKEKDIYIPLPVDDYFQLDFSPVDSLIKIGTEQTESYIDEILEKVGPLPEDRSRYRESLVDYDHDKEIVQKVVTDLRMTKRQQRFVRRIIKDKNEDLISLQQTNDRYNKLISTTYFKDINPYFITDISTGLPKFYLDFNPESKLNLNLGGNVATFANSQVYFDINMDFLSQNLYNLGLNLFAGIFYKSSKFEGSALFPDKKSLKLTLDFTHIERDYTRTDNLLTSNISQSTLVERSENFINASIDKELEKRDILYFRVSSYNAKNTFFRDNTQPSENFALDISGNVRYNAGLFAVGYLYDKLNDPNYPTNGAKYLAEGKLIIGHEDSKVTDDSVQIDTDASRNWFQVKGRAEKYYEKVKWGWGFSAEALFSTVPEFGTYSATLLHTPVYYPLKNSFFNFSKAFRASSYLAGSLTLYYKLSKTTQLRASVHSFTGWGRVEEDGEFSEIPIIEYNNNNSDTAIDFSFVAQTPVGPLSLSTNYSSDPQMEWSFYINFGYLLYNPNRFED